MGNIQRRIGVCPQDDLVRRGGAAEIARRNFSSISLFSYFFLALSDLPRALWLRARLYLLAVPGQERRRSEARGGRGPRKRDPQRARSEKGDLLLGRHEAEAHGRPRDRRESRVSVLGRGTKHFTHGIRLLLFLIKKFPPFLSLLLSPRHSPRLG